MPELTITLTIGVGVILGGIVKLGLAILKRYRSRARTRWKEADSSVKHTRHRLRQLWADVNNMAGNRDDVLMELGKAVPALKQVEDAIVAARRACEDIDREREQLTVKDLNSGLDAHSSTSRLGVVWKLVGEKLEPDGGDRERDS